MFSLGGKPTRESAEGATTEVRGVGAGVAGLGIGAVEAVFAGAEERGKPFNATAAKDKDKGAGLGGTARGVALATGPGEGATFEAKTSLALVAIPFGVADEWGVAETLGVAELSEKAVVKVTKTSIVVFFEWRSLAKGF